MDTPVGIDRPQTSDARTGDQPPYLVRIERRHGVRRCALRPRFGRTSPRIPTRRQARTSVHGLRRPVRRLPTRGFSNQNFETNWYIINVEQLNRFDNGATVDVNALIEAGLVPDAKVGVKILGNGELTKKLTVVAGWYSKSAAEKIKNAGGAAQNLKNEEFQFPKPKPRFIPRAPKKKGAEEAPAEGGEKPAEAKAEGAKPEGKKQKAPRPEGEKKPAPEAKEEPKAE